MTSGRDAHHTAEMKTTCGHPVIALINLALGLVFLFFFVFVIPARYPLVTLFFTALGAGCLLSAWGLWRGTAWGRLLARVVSAVSITIGTGFSLLCLGAASYLSGVYGNMGKASASIFFVMLTLAGIILILLPAIQLYHLRNRRPSPGNDPVP